jgi:hypothetical protein
VRRQNRRKIRLINDPCREAGEVGPGCRSKVSASVRKSLRHIRSVSIFAFFAIVGQKERVRACAGRLGRP